MHRTESRVGIRGVFFHTLRTAKCPVAIQAGQTTGEVVALSRAFVRVDFLLDPFADQFVVV